MQIDNRDSAGGRLTRYVDVYKPALTESGMVAVSTPADHEEIGESFRLALQTDDSGAWHIDDKRTCNLLFATPGQANTYGLKLSVRAFRVESVNALPNVAAEPMVAADAIEVSR